jgi:hypothetical protein
MTDLQLLWKSKPTFLPKRVKFGYLGSFTEHWHLIEQGQSVQTYMAD